MVGGIITYITRKFGVGEERGINRIEGKNRLDIDTLIAMLFIKPHPPDNMTYELRLNVPQCLFILPNPPRNDTGVEENFLYFGANPQVHEDHGNAGGNEEEDVGHLQHDPVHHEQEADGQFGDNRWTWVQNEIQRMSTEQQRQGAELSGLRGDVQRGNRMHEQNNQMLLRMMQHFNLQDPPPG